MSSSPPPLVASFDSSEVRPSPSYSVHDELPAPARVPDRLRQTSGGNRPGLASTIRPHEGGIGSGVCRGSSSCEVSVIASDAVPSLSGQSTASGAGLNPFAREFVPYVTSSPPENEQFDIRPQTKEVATTAEDGSQWVSGNSLEGTQKNASDPSEGKAARRMGGLARALKDGQPSQERTGCTGDVASPPVAGIVKRGQFTSANHLLNFQYDPIVRRTPSHRSFFPRKQQKAQPFNKELFVQANFRFLVSDFGDYLLNSSDPDKMLHWEDVAALTVAAPVPVQCPICLETPPVCPQITSCGHIFCFPCILRYFLLGISEQRNDLFKKCPLCFAITSSKELRTVFVDTVHNYQVGDMIELTLVNRLKGSIIPFERNEGAMGSLPYSKYGQFHPFSKFTLTSDVAETTDKAVAELSRWIEGAQNESGTEEDLDMITFAFLAIEHLQERKDTWNEHRASEFLSCSPPVRQRIVAQAKDALGHSRSHGLKVSDAEHAHSGKQGVDVASETEAAMAHLKDRAGWVYEDAFSDDEKNEKLKASANQRMLNNDVRTKGSPACSEDKTHEKAHEREKQSASNKCPQQTSKGEDEDDDCYAFFQCADGQPLIMHPINMKCLLQHYQSYENLPSRFEAKILEMEGHSQTEALRKRYRYLSHFPLTTNFWFCEVDLRGLLPSSAFIPFNDELRFRETRRRRRQKQEHVERSREDRMSAIINQNSPPTSTLPFIEDQNEDVQLLVSGSTESNPESLVPASGPVDQRKLFSQVTRLGFASAHDAPDLTPAKSGEESVLGQEKAQSAPWSGASGKASTMSFADVIQAQPSKASSPPANGAYVSSQSSSKKNKKSSKVLLSTAGGRRY